MRPETSPFYLVDTNIISSKVTFQNHPEVSRWLLAFSNQIRISVISMAEIAKGLNALEKSISREREGPTKRRRLQGLAEKRDWQNTLSAKYYASIEPIDLPVAVKWAEISARFPQLRDADHIILATAIVRGHAVATRNVRDFKSSGVSIVNPFDPSTWAPKPDGDPIALLRS